MSLLLFVIIVSSLPINKAWRGDKYWGLINICSVNESTNELSLGGYRKATSKLDPWPQVQMPVGSGSQSE